MKWIIFYGDGTRFSSSQGTWAKAPDGKDNEGVQVVVTWPPRRPKTLWDGCDGYWIHRGDMCVAIAPKRFLEPIKGVKYGKKQDDDRYAEIREKALRAKRPR